MIHGHGGNVHAWAQRLGCRPEEIFDVSSNINPLGPPPGLMDHLREHLPVVCRLPEVDSGSISARMSAWLGVGERRILAGAGTTQFIHAMFPVLQSKRVLIVGPTYSDYADACRLQGITPQFCLAEARDHFGIESERLDRSAGQADTVVICNPNNPTGALISREALYFLCRRHPGTRFVIDESYLPFVPDAETHSMVGSGLENVLVLHSLSKIYRLPGLRMGFIIAAPHIIDVFRRRMLPWSLNSLAQAAVTYLVERQESIAGFVRRSRDFIAEERERFRLRFQQNPVLKVFPSCTNFFLIELPPRITSAHVCGILARERVLVRDCSNFHGLSEQFIRIAIHQPKVNAQVAGMLLACVIRTLERAKDTIHG